MPSSAYGNRRHHLVFLWRLRYKLSLRDLAEMFLTRGLTFTHEAVRDWKERFVPLLTERLRAKRRGQAGQSWYVDETFIKVDGRWCYLYRAIDRDGNLIDVMLSEKRDIAAAQRFLRQARELAGQRPEKVTTNGHDAYPRAVREVLGEEVVHRTSRYLNNLRAGPPAGQATVLPDARLPTQQNRRQVVKCRRPVAVVGQVEHHACPPLLRQNGQAGE